MAQIVAQDASLGLCEGRFGCLFDTLGIYRQCGIFVRSIYWVYQASDMIHCVIFVSGLFVWGVLYGVQDVCMVPVRMGVISQPQSMMLMHLIDL